ncbi:MAG TPA: retention module-containing protein, partial [Ramlibacter sp.]|nr:retention module-containing protein [Ramlibacter sp.]
MQPGVVGTVVLLEGVAFARNAQGQQRQLKFGDAVFEGEVIVTLADSRVELAFENGTKFVMRAKETVTLDSTVFGNELVLPGSEDGGLLERIGELTDIAKAMFGSSGEGAAQESSSGGTLNARVGADDGNGFVQLLRTVEEVNPATFQFAPAIQPAVQDPIVPAAPAPTGGAAAAGSPATAPASSPASAPIQGVPAGQAGAEDTPVVFSAAGGNGITVS